MIIRADGGLTRPPTLLTRSLAPQVRRTSGGSRDVRAHRRPLTAHRSGRTRPLIALAFAGVLALASACGGGGGGNDNQNAPAPTATATPTGPQAANVVLTVNASAPLQSFRLRIAYPTGAGGFRGSSDTVACTPPGNGTFVGNDRDDGVLTLVFASATDLTTPVSIGCTFDVAAGHTLAAGDLGANIVSVTSNDVVGNPTVASASVTVQ
jgi:hypothetical protein